MFSSCTLLDSIQWYARTQCFKCEVIWCKSWYINCSDCSRPRLWMWISHQCNSSDGGAASWGWKEKNPLADHFWKNRTNSKVKINGSEWRQTGEKPYPGSASKMLFYFHHHNNNKKAKSLFSPNKNNCVNYYMYWFHGVFHLCARRLCYRWNTRTHTHRNHH